ncbi:MAG: M20/M25/M40 family metallo-hydrolase, partial [Bacteroidota bacterium]
MKISKALLIALCFPLFVFSQDSTAIKSQVAQAIQDLREFVALPSDALVPEDIDDNLFWLKKQFEKRGFNTTEIPTDNLPLFFATMPMEDDKPTILIYMHFDGQGVEAAKWDQPDPYKVVLKKPAADGFETVAFDKLGDDIDYDWRLFGRATADDKGPIIMFLNAFDLLKKEGKAMPYNIKVILDSEEEKGSKPLPKAVKQYRELLEADFLLIADGPMHPSGRPTIVFGTRGITTLTLTTYGPIKHQHSGHYGNYAPNPGFQLAQILAGMKDTEGRVTIKGYYDGVTVDDNTTTILKRVPDDDKEISEKLQIKTHEKVGGYYQESLQYPSLNIRGLSSGWVGDEARTIVPQSATAELDLRLVPETDGARLKQLVKDHITKQGFHILDHTPSKAERLAHDKIVTVVEGSIMNPFRTSFDNLYGLSLVKTLEDTFKKEVVQIRIMGGTVPIAPFINELDISAFVVPMVNADNNQHSPNE